MSEGISGEDPGRLPARATVSRPEQPVPGLTGCGRMHLRLAADAAYDGITPAAGSRTRSCPRQRGRRDDPAPQVPVRQRGGRRCVQRNDTRRGRRLVVRPAPPSTSCCPRRRPRLPHRRRSRSSPPFHRSSSRASTRCSRSCHTCCNSGPRSARRPACAWATRCRPTSRHCADAGFAVVDVHGRRGRREKERGEELCPCQCQ